MSLVDKLVEELMIDKTAFMSFVATAPHRYKKYEIDKRNGKGKRLIAHPSKHLKYIQRLLIDELETVLDIHNAAMAYRKGIGIRDNAEIHSKSRYLLKMDFSDFFYSINPSMFFRVAELKGIAFSEEEKTVLSQLLFCRIRRKSSLTLSIGAPSSPLISNFAMVLFDEALSDYCKENNILYSRYADDIIFSTNCKDRLFNVPTFVGTYLSKYCFGFVRVNPEKTVFSSKAHNRHVTGVTITNEGELSLGRLRKRKISSLVHKFSIGLLDKTQINELRGLLSFANGIEPQFIVRLENKYGCDLLTKIKSYKNV